MCRSGAGVRSKPCYVVGYQNNLGVRCQQGGMCQMLGCYPTTQQGSTCGNAPWPAASHVLHAPPPGCVCCCPVAAKCIM